MRVVDERTNAVKLLEGARDDIRRALALLPRLDQEDERVLERRLSESIVGLNQVLFSILPKVGP